MTEEGIFGEQICIGWGMRVTETFSQCFTGWFGKIRGRELDRLERSATTCNIPTRILNIS